MMQAAHDLGDEIKDRLRRQVLGARRRDDDRGERGLFFFLRFHRVESRAHLSARDEMPADALRLRVLCGV